MRIRCLGCGEPLFCPDCQPERFDDLRRESALAVVERLESAKEDDGDVGFVCASWLALIRAELEAGDG